MHQSIYRKICLNNLFCCHIIDEKLTLRKAPYSGSLLCVYAGVLHSLLLHVR